MTGAAHHRRGGNGYIRSVVTAGERRYHAYLRSKFLGSFETRARAQRAVDDALGISPSVPPAGGDAA